MRNRNQRGKVKMSGPAKNDIPCLSKLYRLQWEKAQDAYVLLYPEGMVKLNESAGEILSRVDGTKSISSLLKNLRRSLEYLTFWMMFFLSLNWQVQQGWLISDNANGEGKVDDK